MLTEGGGDKVLPSGLLKIVVFVHTSFQVPSNKYHTNHKTCLCGEPHMGRKLTGDRRRKLTDEHRAEILDKLSGGMTAYDLGIEYGVSDQTIYRVEQTARARAWEQESAAQARDGGETVVPPVLVRSQAERVKRVMEAVTDPLTGATVSPAESDGAICRNVTRDLYAAFRAAKRDEDYRTLVDIGKTIAAVVRARHQIAPPKAARGPLKTYTVEASPESWPEPPKKDDEDGKPERQTAIDGS